MQSLACGRARATTAQSHCVLLLPVSAVNKDKD